MNSRVAAAVNDVASINFFTDMLLMNLDHHTYRKKRKNHSAKKRAKERKEAGVFQLQRIKTPIQNVRRRKPVVICDANHRNGKQKGGFLSSLIIARYFARKTMTSNFQELDSRDFKKTSPSFACARCTHMRTQ